ncbi:MAG: multicopper oxidase domain-containing protein [Chitinophagaceae bacterium]|nr:multicopper oxidase domain-containing protein [Chitinophagaceae bacterium]
MKRIFLIANILFLSVFAFAQQDMKDMPGMKMDKAKSQPIKKPQAKNKQTEQTQKVIYTCVMHPEVKMDKPGNCPKCGMKLIKKTVNISKQKSDKQIHDGMQMGKDTMPMNKEMKDMPGMQMPAQPKGGNKDKHAGNQTDMGNMKKDMDGMKMNMSAEPAYTKFQKNYLPNNNPPRTVRYDLYIGDTMVNFSGKVKRAIAVNGQIPMPTLTFTEGDTAEIYVHNNLKEETALHWHGLHLPNQYDGVPNLTQMPIMPHTTHLYKFPIIQNGTHFYHSHSMFQEQIGMYGMFIMNKRKEWDIPTIPVVLSEWADMKPEEINRSLHNATDWFAIKKGTTQSYAEAIKTGHFKTKITNEWKRMNAMDVSDVTYDAFLINGKKQDEYPQFKAGDKVRLRIANGGASDYYWLTYSGGKITVVASDGLDVEPVEVDRLIIAVSETYDVVVTIPENKSYEFLVTPEDRTKSTSLWLGSGEKVPATKMPKLKYFAGMKMMNNMMDMHGNMIEMEGMKMQNQEMDMNTIMYPEITGFENPKDTMQPHKMQSMKMDDKMQVNARHMQMNNGNHSMAGMDMDNMSSDIVTLNYGMLRSTYKTTLTEGPVKEMKFDLTGNMNRYVWTLDNKTISESDRILIKKGENVKIIMFNNSMMRHPMHLHGHDFRVLNGQGDYSPLKNVIDIMPMERDTIEFAANKSGDWFFHCHILYHMMSGMGRIFRYENSPPNPEIPNPALAYRNLKSDDRMFHFMTKVDIQSNGSDGQAMLANTRYKISEMWHLGYHAMHGYESETMVGRYLGRMQWWYPYVGFDYHYKTEGAYQKNFFDLSGSVKNIFGSEEKNWFGQKSNKNNRHTVVAGIAYTLPTLTIADFRVDGDGKLRFQLSREDIPLTPRLRFNWMLNTDKEYMASFRYIVTKYFSLSSHYDSDMGIGAGITITY